MRRIRGQYISSNVRHGFTITELLVVIAMIALMSAVLLPTIQQAREASKSELCQKNLKQIAGGHGVLRKHPQSVSLPVLWKLSGPERASL